MASGSVGEYSFIVGPGVGELVIGLVNIIKRVGAGVGAGVDVSFSATSAVSDDESGDIGDGCAAGLDAEDDVVEDDGLEPGLPPTGFLPPEGFEKEALEGAVGFFVGSFVVTPSSVG